MNKVSELKSILGQYLPWNKARLDCFAKMLLALLAVRTVNLSEIAVAFASTVEISSRYKRLQRFFAQFDIDYTRIALWLFQLFFSKNDSVYIAIDRTNWYWGKQKINVFMLSIAYEGVAIPIYWILLDKAGNSNFKEQQKLISRFIDTFGSSCIQGLLADREFASGKLFKWLNNLKIPFYIRIKEGSLVRIHKKQKPWSAKKLFKHVQMKTHVGYLNHVIVFGVCLRLGAGRSERGELMIIATNAMPDNAVPIYLRRWEIENLFQSLKGRGFRFEDTHMTNRERIEKLMALLAIGFCWSHKVGEWRAIKKPIMLKRFRHEKRPQYNFFRYGLDIIRESIINLVKKGRHLIKFIRFLSTQEAFLDINGARL